MILVVYSHICHFCLGDSLLGYNGTFFLFRLPCFFFISGWLFEPVSLRPFRQIVRKKFMVQIVPTFIFLLLLAPPPEFFNKLGTLKGGYWFTFVLFEFFVLYMLIVRISIRWSALMALSIAIGSFIYARYFDSIRASSEGWQLMTINALGFASVTLWRLFLFFYLGAWVRRHFEAFIRWTSKPAFFAIISIVCFYCSIKLRSDSLF